MSRYGYASRGSRVSASALFACMGGLGEERRGEERGEAGGWRSEGWGRGEGLEVNDLSLSLSLSFLFIY